MTPFELLCMCLCVSVCADTDMCERSVGVYVYIHYSRIGRAQTGILAENTLLKIKKFLPEIAGQL